MYKKIEIQYKSKDVKEIVKDFNTMFTDFKISKFDTRPGKKNFTQFCLAQGSDLDGDIIYAKNKLDGKLYSIVFDLIGQRFICELEEKD